MTAVNPLISARESGSTRAQNGHVAHTGLAPSTAAPSSPTDTAVNPQTLAAAAGTPTDNGLGVTEANLSSVDNTA